MARDCKNGVFCYRCKKIGHVAADCPESADAQSGAPRAKSESVIFVAQNGGNSNSIRAAALVSDGDKKADQSVKPASSNGMKMSTSSGEKQPFEVKTPMLAKAATTGPTAQKKKMFLKIDTGADVTVCEPELLSDVADQTTMIFSFDGEKHKSTKKGILRVVVADALDSSKTVRLNLKAYGCDCVGSTPLISWKNLMHTGAEILLAKDKRSFIDLKKVGGPRLHIHDYGRMDVTCVKSCAISDGWQTVRRSYRPARPRSAQRFAPRQTIAQRQGPAAKND